VEALELLTPLLLACPNARVLDVGAGSGYLTACFGRPLPTQAGLDQFPCCDLLEGFSKERGSGAAVWGVSMSGPPTPPARWNCLTLTLTLFGCPACRRWWSWRRPTSGAKMAISSRPNPNPNPNNIRRQDGDLLEA
jgi:hypothetical protein